jgi:hypothetical protein
VPKGYRVHWRLVINDLQRAGVGLDRQAKHAGVAVGTVWGWMGGAHPRHADGERLLDLWMLHLRKERTDVPIVAESSYLL